MFKLPFSLSIFKLFFHSFPFIVNPTTPTPPTTTTVQEAKMPRKKSIATAEIIATEETTGINSYELPKSIG